MDKNIKKIILLSFISLLGISVYLGSKKLKDEKRWFYSTGTNEVVFGEITWGMSQQEVERALGYNLYKPDKFSKSSETKSLLKIEEFTMNLNSYQVDLQSYNFRKESPSPNIPIPENVKSLTLNLIGKPLTNFFGVKTGGVCYLFYKNKLCGITILPFIVTPHYSEKEFDFQINKFKKLFLDDLHRKFGKLILKYSQNNLNLLISNSNVKTTIMDFNMRIRKPKIKYDSSDFESIFYGKEFVKNNYFFDGSLNLRYKPIFEEINKDIKLSETSFFK